MQERQGIIRAPQRVEASLQEGRPSALPNRNTGSSPMSHTSSNIPFKEQQLKQLRAQCLVFLAFRSAFLFICLFLVVSLSISRFQSMTFELQTAFFLVEIICSPGRCILKLPWVEGLLQKVRTKKNTHCVVYLIFLFGHINDEFILENQVTVQVRGAARADWLMVWERKMEAVGRILVFFVGKVISLDFHPHLQEVLQRLIPFRRTQKMPQRRSR